MKAPLAAAEGVLQHRPRRASLHKYFVVLTRGSRLLRRAAKAESDLGVRGATDPADNFRVGQVVDVAVVHRDEGIANSNLTHAAAECQQMFSDLYG